MQRGSHCIRTWLPLEAVLSDEVRSKGALWWNVGNFTTSVIGRPTEFGILRRIRSIGTSQAHGVRIVWQPCRRIIVDGAHALIFGTHAVVLEKEPIVGPPRSIKPRLGHDVSNLDHFLVRTENADILSVPQRFAQYH